MSVELLAGVGITVSGQKREKASVDWSEVGIQAALGGASGIPSAGSDMWLSGVLSKAGGTVVTESGPVIGGTTPNDVSYPLACGPELILKTNEPWDARGLIGSPLGGATSAGIGGLARHLVAVAGTSGGLSKIITAFDEQSLRSVGHGNSWVKAGLESTRGTVAESMVTGLGNSISAEGM